MQRQQLLCLVHSGHYLLTSPYFCLILLTSAYFAHRIARPLPPLHGTVGERMIQVEYRHKVRSGSPTHLTFMAVGEPDYTRWGLLLTGRVVSHIALK